MLCGAHGALYLCLRRQASSLQQTVMLSAGSAVLEFDTTVCARVVWNTWTRWYRVIGVGLAQVNWREVHTCLKVQFDVTVRAPMACYETQFGYIERPTHSNTSWDTAKFEV